MKKEKKKREKKGSQERRIKKQWEGSAKSTGIFGIVSYLKKQDSDSTSRRSVQEERKGL